MEFAFVNILILMASVVTVSSATDEIFQKLELGVELQISIVKLRKKNIYDT